jgi:hypothetical protein
MPKNPPDRWCVNASRFSPSLEHLLIIISQKVLQIQKYLLVNW